MFKQNEKVIYPNHGVGIIESISKVDFNGDQREYYHIEFDKSDISISIPTKNATNLGLSALPTKKELRKNLSKLGNEINMDERNIEKIKSITTRDVNTTNTEEIVKVVNEIEAYKRNKEAKLEKELERVLNMSKKFLNSIAGSLLSKKFIDTLPYLDNNSLTTI